MSKFEMLTQLIEKGRLEADYEVGNIRFRLRTLTHDQEVAAVEAALGRPYAIKIEYLTRSIVSLNGKPVSDDVDERNELREALGKLAFQYINAFNEKYVDLNNKIPKLDKKEDLADPLVQGALLDQPTKLL